MTQPNARHPMSISLRDEEMQVLEQLSKEKGLSKNSVLRQALRLYQLVEVRASRGERMAFMDENNHEIRKVVML